MVALFHLRNGPVVEFKIRLRVFPSAGEVRHPATGDYRDAFRAGSDYFSDGFPKLRASPSGWQRRQISVDENRDDRNFPSFEDPFINRGERVAEDGVLR